MDWIIILQAGVASGTVLLFATIGEIFAERSGVLNLGVEGMMIMGAVLAFAGIYYFDSMILALLFGTLGGMALALLFGFLTLTLATNQVASGLSLTLLGLGLSGMIGEAFIGQPGRYLPALEIPGLSAIPLLGPVLFGQNVLVYFSFALLAGVSWFLFRTRAGLVLRAVGNSHESAHALGYPVLRIRYLAVLFGGGCAGLAGAYLPLAYTPQWTEGMTAGRGWIALALVVFASWLPLRAAVGAYLFGAVLILQFHAQAAEVDIPSQFLSALPYLATIAVLVIISRNRLTASSNTPRALGRVFVPDR
jgi:simple sugar transport system permease protein